MTMKKVLLVLVAVLCVATVSAKKSFVETITSQDWTLGLRVGSGFQANTECFYAADKYVEARFGMGYLIGLTANFQALHNWNVCNWDWTPSVGKWYLDAGCGINLGGAANYAYYGVSGQVKFGIKFDKVPIRLAIDYTPTIGGQTVYGGGLSASSFYTYGLGNFGISAVYCF